MFMWPFALTLRLLNNWCKPPMQRKKAVLNLVAQNIATW
jgi:hypothetical protein